MMGPSVQVEIRQQFVVVGLRSREHGLARLDYSRQIDNNYNTTSAISSHVKEGSRR